MGVNAVGTSNVGLNSSLKEASAIADAALGSNISLLKVTKDYLAPGDTAAPYAISVVDGVSYRKLVVSIDTTADMEGTVSVSYPTSPTHYRYAGSGTPASDNTLLYSEASSGQMLYLRGVSYSTWSYVSITANPTYGYVFNGWSWYNEADTYQTGNTSNPIYLYSTSYTGQAYYRLEAEFGPDIS